MNDPACPECGTNSFTVAVTGVQSGIAQYNEQTNEVTLEAHETTITEEYDTYKCRSCGWTGPKGSVVITDE